MKPSESDVNEKIVPAVRAVVKELKHQFSGIHAVSRDDLVQQGVMLVLKEMPKFNPTRAGISTFARHASRNRLRDHRKSLYRERDRIDAVATSNPGPSIDAMEIEPADTSLPVSEYALQVFRHARCLVGSKRPGRGPQTYQPAQMAALAAIRRRLKLSARATQDWMASQPELAKAIGLRRVPSFMAIQRFSNECRGTGRNRKRQMGTKPNSSPWMSEEEAAKALSIHPNTLRTWRRNGRTQLTYLKVGSRFRYRRADIEQYLQRCEVTPKTPGAVQ